MTLDQPLLETSSKLKSDSINLQSDDAEHYITNPELVVSCLLPSLPSAEAVEELREPAAQQAAGEEGAGGGGGELPDGAERAAGGTTQAGEGSRGRQ